MSLPKTSGVLRRWESHLADERRLSPHTVRAYVRAAERLLRIAAEFAFSVPTAPGLGPSADTIARSSLQPIRP